MRDGEVRLADAGRASVMLPGVRRLRSGSPFRFTMAPIAAVARVVAYGIAA
jgi:hypothetical protein